MTAGGLTTMVRGISRPNAMAAALAASLILSGSAVAESVAIDAATPAAAREVAMLRSIAIDRIGGTDGMQLSLAIERALARPGPDGGPYFDLLAGRRGAEEAEAVLQGVVTTGVDEGRVKLTRNRCTEGTEQKCTKRGNVELACTRRIVDVRGDLRIVGGEDGRVLYSQAMPQRREVSWCPGDTRPEPVEETVSELIGTIADQLHRDIVPWSDRVNVRFREGRKGMDKVNGERFKQAIRLTQRDLTSACGEFVAIEAAMPGHPSNAFNLALCEEAAGNLAAAQTAYERARLIEPRAGDIAAALQRVANTMATLEDAEERAARDAV